jgi:hypothetical protein
VVFETMTKDYGKSVSEDCFKDGNTVILNRDGILNLVGNGKINDDEIRIVYKDNHIFEISFDSKKLSVVLAAKQTSIHEREHVNMEVIPLQQSRSTKLNYDTKKCTCNKFYNCHDCRDSMQFNKDRDAEVSAKAFEMFATVLKEERPDTMQAHEERGDLNAWNADTVDRVLKYLWTTGIGGGKPE